MDKIRLRVKLTSGRWYVPEMHPAANMSTEAEIELPPVKPEELKIGKTVLIPVVIDGYSDQLFYNGTRAFKISDIVSILPTPGKPKEKPQDIPEKEIDFEGLRAGTSKGSIWCQLADAMESLSKQVSEMKREAK